MPLVYLAGPITGRTAVGAKEWRAHAAEALGKRGVHAISPLRGKDYLNAQVEADGKYKRLYDIHPMSTPHGITMRDRWDSARCDVVLAYIPADASISIGTIMEIAWASISGRYVVGVLEGGMDNPHWHAMLVDSCSLVLNNLEEALSLIPVILGVDA